MGVSLEQWRVKIGCFIPKPKRMVRISCLIIKRSYVSLSLKFVLLMLLLCAGDVESNPGPKEGNIDATRPGTSKTKYPEVGLGITNGPEGTAQNTASNILEQLVALRQDMMLWFAQYGNCMEALTKPIQQVGDTMHTLLREVSEVRQRIEDVDLSKRLKTQCRRKRLRTRNVRRHGNSHKRSTSFKRHARVLKLYPFDSAWKLLDKNTMSTFLVKPISCFEGSQEDADNISLPTQVTGDDDDDRDRSCNPAPKNQLNERDPNTAARVSANIHKDCGSGNSEVETKRELDHQISSSLSEMLQNDVKLQGPVIENAETKQLTDEVGQVEVTKENSLSSVTQATTNSHNHTYHYNPAPMTPHERDTNAENGLKEYKPEDCPSQTSEVELEIKQKPLSKMNISSHETSQGYAKKPIKETTEAGKLIDPTIQGPTSSGAHIKLKDNYIEQTHETASEDDVRQNGNMREEFNYQKRGYAGGDVYVASTSSLRTSMPINHEDVKAKEAVISHCNAGAKPKISDSGKMVQQPHHDEKGSSAAAVGFFQSRTNKTTSFPTQQKTHCRHEITAPIGINKNKPKRTEDSLPSDKRQPQQDSLTTSSPLRLKITAFRTLLYGISNSLSKEEVCDLAYLCQDFGIKKQKRMDIEQSGDAKVLFNLLEEMGLISTGDVKFLCEHFEYIKRVDLAKEVNKHTENYIHESADKCIASSDTEGDYGVTDLKYPGEDRYFLTDRMDKLCDNVNRVWAEFQRKLAATQFAVESQCKDRVVAEVKDLKKQLSSMKTSFEQRFTAVHGKLAVREPSTKETIHNISCIEDTLLSERADLAKVSATTVMSSSASNENVSTAITHMPLQIRLENVEEDINDVKEQLQEESERVKELKGAVDKLSEDSDATSNTVTSGGDSVESLKSEIAEMKKSINDIKKEKDDLENRERRNNLVFFGVPQDFVNLNESWEESEEKVKRLVRNQLGLKGKIVIDWAHRNLNAPIVRGSKPIVTRFGSYKDREQVLRKAFKLKGTGISISEDVTRRIRKIRSKLWEHRRSFFGHSKDLKAYLQYDKLVVKDTTSKRIFSVNEETGLIVERNVKFDSDRPK
ncbi:kinesin-like protein KIF15 [Ptychodera flava]|uniref:kinesin-like protein KIF15 n=1 Tax=Ptychodera flava TaxID=63121 RepID=UPI00396A0ECC